MSLQKIRQACEQVLHYIVAGNLKAAEKALSVAAQMQQDAENAKTTNRTLILMTSLNNAESKIDFPSDDSAFLEKQPKKPMTVMQMFEVVQGALNAAKRKQEIADSVKQAKDNCELAMSEIACGNFLKARTHLTQARRQVFKNATIASEQVEFQQSTKSVVAMLAVVEEKLGPVNDTQDQSEKTASAALSLNDFQAKGEFVPQRFANEFKQRIQNELTKNLANLSNVKQRAEKALEYCQQALTQLEQGGFVTARGCLAKAQAVCVDIPNMKVNFRGSITIAAMLKTTREKINQFSQEIEDARKFCVLIFKKILAVEYKTAEALFPIAQQSCISEAGLKATVLFFEDVISFANGIERFMTVREMLDIVQGELEESKIINTLRTQCVSAFHMITRNGSLDDAENILKRVQGFPRRESIANATIQFFIRVNETELKQGSMTLSGMITTLAIELSRARRNQGQKKANTPIKQTEVSAATMPLSDSSADPAKAELQRSSSVLSFLSSIFSSGSALQPTTPPTVADTESLVPEELPIADSRASSVAEVNVTGATATTTTTTTTTTSAAIAAPSVSVSLIEQLPQSSTITTATTEMLVSSAESSTSPAADELKNKLPTRKDREQKEADKVTLQKQLAKEALQRSRSELAIESALPLEDTLINLNVTLTDLLANMQSNTAYQINFQRLAKDIQAVCNRFIKLLSVDETNVQALAEKFSEVMQNYRDAVLFALVTMGEQQLSIGKQQVFKKYVDSFVTTCKLMLSISNDIVPVFEFKVGKEYSWHPYLIDSLKKAGITLKFEQAENFEIGIVQAFQNKLDNLQLQINKVIGNGPTDRSQEMYKDNDAALSAYMNKLKADVKEVCEIIGGLMQKDLVSYSEADPVTKQFLDAMSDYRDGIFFMLSQMGEKLQDEYINAFSTAYQPKRNEYVKQVNGFIENCEAIERIENAVGLPKARFKISEGLHPYLKNKIEVAGMVPPDSPYSWSAPRPM